MTTMSTATALITVEEFLRFPEPKSGHYELHHGEVIFVTAPKWGHARIQDRVRAIFERMVADRGVVRMEMSFRPAPEYEVWVADVGVVQKQRADDTGDDEYLQGAPDLVVEVLSPSNTVEEINDKMTICLEHGCKSFWLIDRKHKMVAVTESDVTRRYKTSDTITNDVLGGSIQVSEIFQNS